ncbi:MAG: cofactor-independent phosphoglycerate mutase, partial [Caldicoprobacterales bacterium]
MKYIVLLGDGMADYPVPELGGKTPLQAARKPNMDFLAAKGETGLVSTIPQTLPPGSDVANLSVLGYDPEKYYTGRSPLEAASMGVPMDAGDIAFRTNLVTLSEADHYGDRIMLDHSSDEISSGEAAQLMEEVSRHFQNDFLTFYTGVSYRHCLLWKNGSTDFDLTPPHDIVEKKIGSYLPKGKDADIILQMMEDSTRFLADHPVNRERIRRGLRPANSIWIWGQGRKPAIPSFYEKYGLKGAVISAVDLVKGLGLCAGMESIDVEGATGNLHTNYLGKAQAALQALKSGRDFVYIHVEAPDECGHRYEIQNKVRAIELIDEQVLGTIIKG